MESIENSWVVSLRMISVDEDDAYPFDDFFFVVRFDDLDDTTKYFDAMLDDWKSLMNRVR